MSPALQFLAARQQAELSPVDAERLGLGAGERVEVRAGEAVVRATVVVRANVPEGTVFLGEATATDSATALSGGLVEVRPARVEVPA
jgi:NADH-quinone oxidoreductase subunit G